MSGKGDSKGPKRPRRYASKPAEMQGLRRKGETWYLDLKRKDVTYSGSLGTKDLSEAIAKRALIINRGRLESNSDGFKACYRRFLDEKTTRNEYTASSLKGKPYAVLKFGERVGDIPPSALRLHHVQSWYDHLLHDKGLSPETCHGYVKALQAFAKWCLARRPPLTQLDFTDGVRMEKFEPGVRDKWCEAELRDRLCKEAATSFERGIDGKTVKWESREDIQFACYAGFHCGLRMSEVVALRPEWFDLGQRILSIPCKRGVFIPKGDLLRKNWT